MKKYIAIFLGALMLLPLASCRRDDMSPEEARAAKRQNVFFTATMTGYEQVKSTDVSFEDGDLIGIYAQEPFDVVNAQARVKGNIVKPITPFMWEMVHTALFIAYYPYDASYGASPQVSFSVKTDQRTYDAYKASDLRGAVALGKNGETVELPFRHMLSKLTVLVNCEDKAEQVTAVTIGGVSSAVAADFSVPSVETAGGRSDIQAGKAVPGNGNEGFVAILVPQSLNSLPLMVTTNKGQTLVFEPEKPLTFESGHAYSTSTLNVPKQGGGTAPKLSFTVSITDWGDGGSMDFHRGKQRN